MTGAEPEYLTISISLPKHIDENFVKNFYKGAKEACGDVEIVGGDLTGSDKIFVSVTAIGTANGRKISSRSNAKEGYKITFFTDNKSLFRKVKILLDKLVKETVSKELKENE